MSNKFKQTLRKKYSVPSNTTTDDQRSELVEFKKDDGTSTWKKVELSNIAQKGLDTFGIMSFEELDPSEFYGKPSSNNNSKKKRKIEENEGEPSQDAVEIDNIEEIDVNANKNNDKKKKRKKNKNKYTQETLNKYMNESTINNDKDNNNQNNIITEDNDIEENTENEKENEREKYFEWEKMGCKINELIMKGIREMKYEKPTEIQKKAIGVAIKNKKDIVGAAETGSGKTLAYGIPLINGILNNNNNNNNKYCGISGLILCPTRELAVQVDEHLQKITKYTNLLIVTIVGGISNQKQERLLNSEPDIIVATPGRLWELIQTSDEQHVLSNLHNSLNYLVIDEADRMVETGHFHEVTLILNLLPKFKSSKSKLNEINVDDKKQEQEQEMNDVDEELIDNQLEEQEEQEEHKEEEIEEEEEEEEIIEEDDKTIIKKKERYTDKARQTFIFSATLTVEHMENVTKKQKMGRKKVMNKEAKSVSSLDKLFQLIDFHNKVEIIDITTKEKVVETIQQAKIQCTNETKDHFLYGFLKTHENKGKTLVFVNAISNSRRIKPLFKILNLPVFGLHGEMEQKQRLKNLEKFTKSTNGILIATDVAARGLDIPNIQHVIHYQLPKTAETYIHRCGRTARAGKHGISLALVSPQDIYNYKKICENLHLEQLPDFPFETRLMPAIRQRVELARQVEKKSHMLNKKSADSNWIAKAAKELDVDLDEDEDEEKLYNEKKTKNKIQELTRQLNTMLKTTLAPKGSNKKYLQMTNELGKITNTNKDAYTEIKSASAKVKKPKLGKKHWKRH